MKNYLNKFFFKNFIIFNKIYYFFFVFFVLKINNNLCFYINYCKFNIIIKRNYYFLSFIEKMINKILKYKYFIYLNIIFIFNKLRIYSNNEDFIIFIIILKIFKYRIFFFNLINNFNFFQ